MAGTDRTRRRAKAEAPGLGAAAFGAAAPAVILVAPQLGENIGMAARAMLNCGLTELRLVRPRDGWPSDTAWTASSGAHEVIRGARVFDTTEEAVADLTRVYAATARPRDMTKPVATPAGAAAEILAEPMPTGLMFGGEAMGLDNDDVALADTVITVPLNPGFSSLNIAQAVLLVSWELYKLTTEAPPVALEMRGGRPATKAELQGLFDHLEGALDDSGFLHVEEKRPSMVRALRNVFQRAKLTEQEVRTLRGVIASLVIYGNSQRKKD